MRAVRALGLCALALGVDRSGYNLGLSRYEKDAQDEGMREAFDRARGGLGGSHLAEDGTEVDAGLRSGVLRHIRLDRAEPALEGFTGKSVAIAGAVRDAAEPLPNTLAQIKELCKYFAPCHLVFFENDSRNDTLSILKQSEGTVLSETHIDLAFPERVGRIAYARNKLLHGVAAIEPAPEYLIMVDMDECVSLTPPQNIARALRSSSAWDAVSFDRPDYYDIFALRCEGHDALRTPPGARGRGAWIRKFWDVGKTVQCLRGNLGLEPAAGTKVTEGADTYYRVHSAFNSVAVYKWPIRGQCTYSSDVNGAWDCEHVGFHNCIRSHGGDVVLASWGVDASGRADCGNRPSWWEAEMAATVAQEGAPPAVVEALQGKVPAPAEDGPPPVFVWRDAQGRTAEQVKHVVND